ncbi:MAG TPA: hypothetical protein VMV19_09225 [Xanthobacteraceae bacterium]|nr:hypothetical protein [Xanthobacteraceae bacterium]
MKAEGFHTLSALCRLVGRNRNALVYAAKRGDLGEPRLIGRRKFYSLAAVEAHYGKPATAVQQQRATAPRRSISEILMELTPLIRKLAISQRDAQWHNCLIEQGIEQFKAPERA